MKKSSPEMVNVPGSPGVTTGSVGAPWLCFGIQGRSEVNVTSAGVPAVASVTDTTQVPIPIWGESTGGGPSVTADTSVAR